VARSRSEPVTRTLGRAVWILLFALVAGGTAFLVTWDIPPPTAPVEMILPDDRFPT
jgi:hypothetical protein